MALEEPEEAPDEPPDFPVDWGENTWAPSWQLNISAKAAGRRQREFIMRAEAGSGRAQPGFTAVATRTPLSRTSITKENEVPFSRFRWLNFCGTRMGMGADSL